MKTEKSAILKNILIVFGSAIVFFALTLPFRQLFQVVSVTEVRPVAALNPTFGLLFGVSGALGCAMGNLAADLVSGYSPLMCVLGFAVQMVYGLLPRLLWKSFRSEVRLNSALNILRYMIISAINSAVTSILLGVVMLVTGIGGVFSMTTLMMLLNNFVFCVVLGIPIILTYTGVKLKKTGEKFSLNERFILIFLLLAILSAAIIGIFSVGTRYEQAEDLLAFWNRVYICISVDLLVFSVVIVGFVYYAEKHITIPMENLALIAGEYSRAEKDKGLNTKWIVDECRKYENVHGEAGTLAKAFGEMAVNIEKYVENITAITAENERIGAELNVATQIQADMLPNIFPTFSEKKEFDIFASMDPAKEVGGDFYDFFFTDENHLALVIADVSGKGVPAALFMVIAKTLIKNQALTGQSPKDILMTVNNQLCENNKAEMFVTVWLGILDIRTGVMTAANAGHEYPVICKAGGEYELFKDKHGFVLAGMEDSRYREYEVQLDKGDTLFVYTDGVPEATDSRKELYGTERLLDVLNRNLTASCEETVKMVREDIDRFVGEAEQFDDITMLCLRLSGE